MKIRIANDHESLLLELINYDLMHPFPSDEEWLDAVVSFTGNGISYTFHATFQQWDIKEFKKELNDLINQRNSKASFGCLEEWLNFSIRKKGSLGHYIIEFEIHNDPFVLKSSFLINTAELENIRK